MQFDHFEDLAEAEDRRETLEWIWMVRVARDSSHKGSNVCRINCILLTCSHLIVTSLTLLLCMSETPASELSNRIATHLS